MKFKSSVPIYLAVCLVVGLLSAETSYAQDDKVLSAAAVALSSGSAKSLTNLMTEKVEITLDGDKADYSSTQAQFILKDFFGKNPPEAFDYIREGGSKTGLKYGVGKLTCNEYTYRVVLFFKQFKGRYRISMMNLTRE